MLDSACTCLAITSPRFILPSLSLRLALFRWLSILILLVSLNSSVAFEVIWIPSLEDLHLFYVSVFTYPSQPPFASSKNSPACSRWWFLSLWKKCHVLVTFVCVCMLAVFHVHHTVVGVVGAERQTHSLIHKHSLCYVFFLASCTPSL